LKIPINKIQRKYDLIIIGAGVTGLTILYNLLEQKLNKKVLVLEYGSLFSKDPYPEKFNIISSTNLRAPTVPTLTILPKAPTTL